MTTIVDSIRKHQKMIVLGVALAVITLYIIPLDQIASAVHPKIQKALDRIAAIKAKINANNNIPQSVQDRISAHLDQVAYRLQTQGPQ
jgi:hypothetical protein